MCEAPRADVHRGEGVRLRVGGRPGGEPALRLGGDDEHARPRLLHGDEAKATLGGCPKVTGVRSVARNVRGTGTPPWLARMPCQLTGMSRLPPLSTATRAS